MPSGTSSYIEIRIAGIPIITQLALGVLLPDDDDEDFQDTGRFDAALLRWFPKSLVEDDPDAGALTLRVAEWLAEREGLA